MNSLMELPNISFFLFGMGDRRKLIYMDGVLYDALTCEIMRKWNTATTSEDIRAKEYIVTLETKRGKKVIIQEDTKGVWLNEGGKRVCLTQSNLKLPQFKGHKHAKLLRILYQEILINIINGLPVPNFFVYPKP
jgi:hypothetical protein